VYTGLLRPALTAPFVWSQAPNHILTSLANLIMLATRRSTLGDLTITVTGPRSWKSLPDVIRHNPSLAVFKRLLKTLLFIQSFYSLFLFIV